MRLGAALGPDSIIMVNLSGRGDKDVATAARWFKIDLGDVVSAELSEGR
jgi:tryptophan synthase beta chain